MSDGGSGFSWNLTPQVPDPEDPATPEAEEGSRGLWPGVRRNAASTPAPEQPAAAEPPAPLQPAPRSVTPTAEELSDRTGLPAIEPWTPPASAAPAAPTEPASTKAFVFDTSSLTAPSITPAALNTSSDAGAPADPVELPTQAIVFDPPTAPQEVIEVEEPVALVEPPAELRAPADEPETATAAFAALGFDVPSSRTETPEPLPAAPVTSAAAPEVPTYVAPAATEAFAPRRAAAPAPAPTAADIAVKVAPGGLDTLFADTNFSAVPAPSPAPVTRRAALEAAPTQGLTTTQKVLFWVAGALLVVLAIMAIVLAVNRFGGGTVTPAPVETAADEPAEPELPATGPLPPGEYSWDLLRGGECITPFSSAFTQTFTVVECTEPHRAQLLARGELSDGADAAFPGLDELQARLTAQCTAPEVLNVAIVPATDVQIVAAFPADASVWDDGDRAYDCFVVRADGADFTQDVAVAPAS